MLLLYTSPWQQPWKLHSKPARSFVYMFSQFHYFLLFFLFFFSTLPCVYSVMSWTSAETILRQRQRWHFDVIIITLICVELHYSKTHQISLSFSKWDKNNKKFRCVALRSLTWRWKSLALLMWHFFGAYIKNFISQLHNNSSEKIKEVS